MNTGHVYLFREGEKSGPYAPEDVRAMVARGETNRQVLAWREGLSEWYPLEQLIGFDGLPPLPASVPVAETASVPSEAKGYAQSPPCRSYPPLATISGGLGLLFLLLSVLSIGSCTMAKRELQTHWQHLNSPDGTAEIVLRSLDRGMKGDPFGQIFEMADTRRSLEARADEAQMWAVLCVIGTGVCGVVLFIAKRQMRPVADGGRPSMTS